MPRIYFLALTPLCNNRCPGCSNVFIDDYARRTLKPDVRRHSLHFEQWRTILDRILPHADYVKITGGEPTLLPDFARILQYIDDHEVSYTVFTDGRWHNPDELVGRFAQQRYLRSLLMSLHGADAASHDAFTGIAGSFDETIVNIRRAIAAGLPVVLSTVITHLNFSRLDKIAAMARQLGAEGIAYNRFLIPPWQQAGTQGLAPSTDELRQAVALIEHIKAAELRGGHLRIMYGPTIPQTVAQSSSVMCSAGESFCAIDPWGNVSPCTHTGLACGNLLTDDLETVWSHPNMKAWRELRSLHEVHGGCRAIATELGAGVDPLLNETAPNVFFAKLGEPKLSSPT